MKSLSMTTKNMMSAMLTADLTIVTVWAAFLFHTADVIYPGIAIVFALVLWRLWMSFALYQRQKDSGWLIVIWSVVVVWLTMFGYIDIINAPFEKLWKVGSAFFTGNNSVFLRDEVPSKACGIFSAICAAWVVFVPLLAYAALAVKKLLVSDKWNWRGILLIVLGYAGCTLLFYFYPMPTFNESADFMMGSDTNVFKALWIICSKRALWLLVTTAMLIYFLSKNRRTSKAVLNYCIIAGTVVLALVAGLINLSWISLAILLLCTTGFTLFLYRRWDGTRWRHANLLIGVALASNILFWCSQFCTNLIRYTLLAVSVGVLIVMAILYYRDKHKPLKSVGLVLMCGIVFPTLSIGYNVAACPDVARCGDCYGYRHASFCFSKVRGADGVGIRDRYGMVMPAEYEDFELMDIGKPYYKVKQDGLWGIYDIELQEIAVEPEFKSIERIDDQGYLIKNTWEMVYEDPEYPYPAYFKMPGYYSRNRQNVDVSYDPYHHLLDDYLTLQYIASDEVVGSVEDIDFLLADILRKLWKYDEDEPIADVYWQWTQDVSALIDSLQTSKALFCDPVLDQYDRAVEILKDYIDGGSTQVEMNNASYVLAVLDLYKVHKQNIDFAKLFGNVDMRSEYRLYSQYMKAVEDWEARVSEANDLWYSAKPMEDNLITSMRCENRGASIEEMVNVVSGHGHVKASKPRPSREQIMKSYHDCMPGILIPARYPDDPEPMYPTDTLGIYLLQWVAYRDSIADLMPTEIGRSYKNQTTNIINDMMHLTKPDPYSYGYE